MDTLTAPVPANEMERLTVLAELDLDYSALNDNLKSLSKLAAKIAGTEISMVNLIDSFTQWTVSNYGLDLDQMNREDSVCQYTIMQDEGYEVLDLAADDRFKEKFYVTSDPNLRYYYGVPLRADNGVNLGALCVLDTQLRVLSPEKIEMLKIIADEIVNRLRALRVIESMRGQINEATENQRRVAHDIRGPLGGIIGLARIISEQGDENTMEEVLEFIGLIQKSGHSILELADEILSIKAVPAENANKLGNDEFNQVTFKEKLIKLYTPQALNKKIKFTVNTSADTQNIPFLKNKLLQIVGNLISNAIKFTPEGGSVSTHLSIDAVDQGRSLQIKVEDSGVGLSPDKIQQILSGQGESTTGTGGEQGYGFGLALVKHLIDGLKGNLQVVSTTGNGTVFTVSLPQAISKI
ncbi:sensor histidine kinase [Mucilaginibacter terrae]|uniref:histidine kinase n=1 Tax=Mucilaginibacter terrae TaxID=1955052 RepID=A0ABU3H0Q7_9SPHI|nr:GAF domain-containing sensor histidine kinase [Mucilaginibacter terrae]MDT3405600.1 signal transduction histidine kinase [Mucilaginibacter terrae]